MTPTVPPAVPATMRAAVNAGSGGPEVLAIGNRSVPVPAKGEVLVRVVTSGLNRADLLQRAGRYPAPPGWPVDIPGLEFAGEVAQCGSEARQWKVGDRVFGLVGGGAHAEYLVANERAVARVPDSLSWEQAGTAPEAFITAHDAMITQAGLRPGETMLIHAVGSGVALAAVQLGRALGAIPFGTARSATKIDAARELGLENGLVVTDLATVAPAVMQWTGGRGTSLRARPLEERILATQVFEREVVPWLANGTLTTRIDASYPLASIAQAHAHLETNSTTGKILLQIGAASTA